MTAREAVGEPINSLGVHPIAIIGADLHLGLVNPIKDYEFVCSTRTAALVLLNCFFSNLHCIFLY